MTEEAGIGSELRVCYFAPDQIDRSPTGTGVAARGALAYCRSARTLAVRWEYHLLVFRLNAGFSFDGIVIEEVGEPRPVDGCHTNKKIPVRGKVETMAFYPYGGLAPSPRRKRIYWETAALLSGIFPPDDNIASRVLAFRDLV